MFNGVYTKAEEIVNTTSEPEGNRPTDDELAALGVTADGNNRPTDDELAALGVTADGNNRPEDSIDWSKVVVVPPEDQDMDEFILLKPLGPTRNIFYAVKAQKYMNRLEVPVATDTTDLETFTNFTIPERLFNDINSEMDRRTPEPVPVEVPPVRNDNDFVPVENSRAAELGYQLLKTNTTPPKFKYKDPSGAESSQTFNSEADAMVRIERMAEIRRRAGLVNQ